MDGENARKHRHRQTVKVENTSSSASTVEPVSSPCERRGDEDDRGVRERRADVRKGCYRRVTARVEVKNVSG